MTQNSLSAVQSIPFRKRAERTMGRLGLRLVVGPLRVLPLALTRTFGWGLGVALFHGLGRYRRVALKNLAMIYGNEVDERTRHRMALEVFSILERLPLNS